MEKLKKMLISLYVEKAYTNNYILGFIFHGVVYMATFDRIPNEFIKLDKASRGGGCSIRFKPTTAEKLRLISLGVQAVCSETYFLEVFTSCKYNRGEIFEKLIHDKYGMFWKKDNVKFTEGADIVINGKAYQIKFEKATFSNEKFLLGR